MKIFGRILLLLVMFLSTATCFVYFPDNDGMQLLGGFGVFGTIVAFLAVLDS